MSGLLQPASARASANSGSRSNTHTVLSFVRR
jgi:hypothetical protein